MQHYSLVQFMYAYIKILLTVVCNVLPVYTLCGFGAKHDIL